jgi:hypothetical protein
MQRIRKPERCLQPARSLNSGHEKRILEILIRSGESTDINDQLRLYRSDRSRE